jgi:resuscitation-promoting factor RpfA
MRLVCPNCEAKYEVPDDAIPDSGRDVQCASCGHAWFQMRPRSAAAEAALAPAAAPIVEPEPQAPVIEVDVPPEPAMPDEVVAVAADESASETETVPESDLAIGAVAEADVEAEPEVAMDAGPSVEDVVVQAEVEAEVELGDTTVDAEAVAEAVAAEADLPADAAADAAVDDALDPAPDQDAEPVTDAKAGYAVDESVLAILREEAERESSARRAEARPLEVQADLGIESAVAAPAMAMSAVVAGEDKPSARRDLLPDVEEINSTLRPSENEDAGETALDGSLPASQRSGGFRSGFLWVMTIAMLGAGLYLAAPTLSRTVPSLSDPLEAYVRAVNGLRLELDGLMRSATVALDGE